MAPLVCQVAPWERGHRRGCNSSSTPSNLNFHIDRGGPGQMTPAHSLLTGCRAGNNGNGDNGQGNPGPSARREGTANCQNPNSLQCFRCQRWGHMARESPTPVLALHQPRGTEGIWLTAHLWQPPQPTVGPSHYHPHPRPRPAQHEVSPMNRPRGGHFSCSFFESRPNCLPGRTIQWDLCNCRWAEGDC